MTISLKHIVNYKRITHGLVVKIRNYRKSCPGALESRIDSFEGVHAGII